jgi:DNA-binding response OmpR family regulator
LTQLPRILVVDDEPLISMLVEDWLTELGWEVVGPAASVADGLKLAQSTELDGAILDVNLGNETCYALADALRSRGIPLAFATGDGSLGEVSDFPDPIIVSKPFDFAAVKAAVEALLKRTEKAKAD